MSVLGPIWRNFVDNSDIPARNLLCFRSSSYRGCSTERCFNERFYERIVLKKRKCFIYSGEIRLWCDTREDDTRLFHVSGMLLICYTKTCQIDERQIFCLIFSWTIINVMNYRGNKFQISNIIENSIHMTYMWHTHKVHTTYLWHIHDI